MEEYYYEGERLQQFDAKSGTNETVQVSGETWKAVKTNLRIVELTITSWRVISSGIHYYGKLFVDDVSFSKTGKNKGSIYSTSAPPKGCEGFEIILHRVLLQKEIDNYPNRFQGYSDGDWVHRFNTKISLKKLAQQIFEESFGDGWKLKIDDKC